MLTSFLLHFLAPIFNFTSFPVPYLLIIIIVILNLAVQYLYNPFQYLFGMKLSIINYNNIKRISWIFVPQNNEEVNIGY